MALISGKLPKRQPDGYGSGHFGASRGSRTHNGIDFACYPGTEILSPVVGTVTKLGYPYADDLSYRYVQVTDQSGKDHRFFYVEPSVSVGDMVIKGKLLGLAQDICKRYGPKPTGVMTGHVHYEVKFNGKYLDPEK